MVDDLDGRCEEINAWLGVWPYAIERYCMLASGACLDLTTCHDPLQPRVWLVCTGADCRRLCADACA